MSKLHEDKISQGNKIAQTILHQGTNLQNEKKLVTGLEVDVTIQNALC